MAKRTKELGLGRGLNALLGDPDLQAQGEGSVSLPISQVQPGLNQPRKRFDQDALADLAESIRVHGIIQPLTVRRLSSGYYQIIAGERRWRAAKLAGLAEVPAVIIEADDRKVMELGLIENLQREDLNPAEEARGYQVLMEEYGLTQEQVADRMGKSRPAITNTLRLLALPEDLLKLVEQLQAKGVHLVSNKENIDTSTPTGRLMLTMIGAINEFERCNLLERQREGIAIAKAQGKFKGRKEVKADDFAAQYQRYLNRELNKAQLAKTLGISRPTLDKMIRQHTTA